jgi:c(7)-type cytochrome triheme protein
MKKRIKALIFVLSCLLWLVMATAMSATVQAAPGDIQFEREDNSETEVFPPAVFPHWRHRINFRCDACHDSLFEMKRGGTPVTMDLIKQGEVCGACHNGNLAFNDGFENCSRCHRAPSD